MKKSAPSYTCKIVKAAPTPAIVALYKAGGWWTESKESRAVVPRIVSNSFAFAIAQTPRGKIIGMGRVISDGCSDAYIQDVVVLRDWRGKGVGRALIEELAGHCLRKKIPWVGLVAEPGTYPFYRKIGFTDKKGYQLMLYGQEHAA